MKRFFTVILTLFLTLTILQPFGTSVFADAPYPEYNKTSDAPSGNKGDTASGYMKGIGGNLDDSVKNEINKDMSEIYESLRNQEDKDTSEGESQIEDINTELSNFQAIIQDVITWAITFGIITSILVMIFNFVKMATAPSHPTQRRVCMESIVISIVCIVLLGAVSIILEILYGSFSRILSTGLMYSDDWRYPAYAFLVEYGNLITGFSGLASLTMLVCLGYSFTLLALSAGNPQKKQKAQSAILFSTISTIGIGGITTFVSYLIGLI